MRLREIFLVGEFETGAANVIQRGGVHHHAFAASADRGLEYEFFSERSQIQPRQNGLINKRRDQESYKEFQRQLESTRGAWSLYLPPNAKAPAG